MKTAVSDVAHVHKFAPKMLLQFQNSKSNQILNVEEISHKIKVNLYEPELPDRQAALWYPRGGQQNFGVIEKSQPLKQLIAIFFCTQGRDRTGMSVTSLVFETSASTNSATWAWCQITAAKIRFFLFQPIFFSKIEFSAHCLFFVCANS